MRLCGECRLRRHLRVPIGGLMMEKYLTGQISPHRQYIEDRMLESNTIIYSGVKKH